MPAKITTAALVKAVKKVISSRKGYNQNNWCGTARCIAGHAVTGVDATLEKSKVADDIEHAVFMWARSSRWRLREARRDVRDLLIDFQTKPRQVLVALAEVVRLEKEAKK